MLTGQMQTVWVVIDNERQRPPKVFSTTEKAERAVKAMQDIGVYTTASSTEIDEPVERTVWVVRDAVEERDIEVYYSKPDALRYLNRYKVIPRTLPGRHLS